MIATVVRETGVIKGIADGDTFYLNAKQPSARIRLSGVQATEIAHGGVGTNWCHGLQAKSRLSSLTLNKRVVLKSLYNSYASDGRRLRYAYVLSGGHYVDVQRILLREGHVLWHPSSVEWVNNRLYHVDADTAVAARRSGGIWDTDMCGSGPSQSAVLKMWINWDADGDDNGNVNGEYVVIANDSGYTVPLGGWYVRLNSHAMYRFPSGSYVPARGRIKVHSGRGTRTRSDYHWGSSSALFANDLAHGRGSGAYLLDPQGDFRAWFTYPCVIRCGSSLQSTLKVEQINYSPGRTGPEALGESITLALTGTQQRAYLEGLMVKVGWRTYRFPFKSYMNPGERFTLYLGRDPGGRTTRLTRFWNQGSNILPEAGAKVTVDTYRAVRITCGAYGNLRC